MATNRRPEIRKDSIHNRWVIFSPARAKRPSDFKSKPNPNPNPNSNNRSCPFCFGNEDQCAPEIFRVPQDPNSEWRVRVIQNLYPALSREIGDAATASSDAVSLGHVAVDGFGFHEVVIECPEHGVCLMDLSPGRVGEVLLALRKRVEQLAAEKSIQYVQVFKNHGASAGASLSHSHSQIMALPIIPPMACARMQSMKEHFAQTGKCGLCEVKIDDLVIVESSHFISIVPYAATFPFEMWIVPRDHSPHFHEIDDKKAADLGSVLKLMLMQMSLQLNNPPYNLMIHTSPLKIDSSDLPFAHWFIQIVPQLTVLGGFELATGCYINPVFPEDAAKVLREVGVLDE